MPAALTFVLYLLAFVCFAAAAFGAPVRRGNLTALGLALITLVWVVQAGAAAF